MREPLPGEITRRLRAPSTPLDDSLGAYVLVVERSESLVDDVLRDAGRAEVVSDECVARTSIGEHGGPTLGEPAVVDETGSPKSLERRFALARPDAARLELAIDFGGAPVSVT